jgi:hypothetical protein
MTRLLPFLAVPLLVCCVQKAHTTLNYYRSSWNCELDKALALPGSLDWNDPAYNAGASKSGISLLSSGESGGMMPALVDDPCTELYNDGFESSFGNWIDSGSNCARSTSFPNTGAWSHIFDVYSGFEFGWSGRKPLLLLLSPGIRNR